MLFLKATYSTSNGQNVYFWQARKKQSQICCHIKQHETLQDLYFQQQTIFVFILIPTRKRNKENKKYMYNFYMYYVTISWRTKVPGKFQHCYLGPLLIGQSFLNSEKLGTARTNEMNERMNEWTITETAQGERCN